MKQVSIAFSNGVTTPAQQKAYLQRGKRLLTATLLCARKNVKDEEQKNEGRTKEERRKKEETYPIKSLAMIDWWLLRTG
jgi:hypothetical protein